MIKKIKYLSITLTLALVVLACQKVQDDKVFPVLTMMGNNPMKLIQGCEWIEPGIEVKDDKPGTRLYSTGLPFTGSPGEYYIDYLAVDSDSNQTSLRRLVKIGPLEIQDVVGDYHVDDTVGYGEEIKSYKSTISEFNDTSLLIINLNSIDTLKAIITFDSTGYVEINDTPAARTVISGTGNFHCYKTQFSLSYYIEPPVEGEHHRATFTKIN